jgi:hypothetical protein
MRLEDLELSLPFRGSHKVVGFGGVVYTSGLVEGHSGSDNFFFDGGARISTRAAREKHSVQSRTWRRDGSNGRKGSDMKK